MAKNRVAQVQELMKEELGHILLTQLSMPEKTIVTLTRVDASPNLQQAKVFIAVFPEEKAEEVIRLLGRNIYDIQQQLNERLKMRPVPKIQWFADKELIKAQRIEELLDKIKKEG